MTTLISPSNSEKGESKKANVILIGIDSCRPDHMSSYQYPRKTTPHIDTMAKQGLVFKDCRTVAPWTLPSFFSMMTSTYPSVHLYGTNFRGTQMPTVPGPTFWTYGTISPDYTIQTLAEILREQDYYTAAFVNTVFLSEKFEMSRGFAELKQCGPTAKEGVQQILPWLDRHQDGKFFLFFHIMDLHEYRDREFLLRKIPRPFGEPGEEGLQEQINVYDTYLRYCDEEIGRLFAHLEKLRLDQNTLVIITSDHGEELLEHRKRGHGHSVYDELLRVPLIVCPPHGMEAGKVLENRVSTLDIAPTILNILGLPLPSYYQGMSLVPVFKEQTLSPRPLFAEALLYGNEKKAVLLNDYKLIYTTTVHEFELYNLKADPGETHNLIDELPDVERQMIQILQSFREKANQGIQVTLTPGSKKQEVCEGKLTTTGAFAKVAPLVLSRARIFQTSGDSKEIQFKLANTRETEGFAFEIDPPDASIQLELSPNINQFPTQVYLGSASGKARLSPVVFDRETLKELSSSSAAMDREGLYVWLKDSGRKSKHVEIDESTKERLKALGYLN